MNNKQFKDRVVREIQSLYPDAFSINCKPASESTTATASNANSHPPVDSTSFNEYLESKVNRQASTINNVYDLLELQDEAFIRQCYLVLLRREPDQSGLQNNLESIRNGGVDKLTIVRRFMTSPEGKRAKVKLKSVGRARVVQRLQRLPFIGSMVEIIDEVFRLPRLHQRLGELEEALATQSALLERSLATQGISQDQSNYDQFYLEFENHFRGNRETIRSRQEFYLPVIQKLCDELGMRPVLDISCGRGEWLGLLKENNLPAEGVDINAASLAECRIRNLTVHHRDAFEFLQESGDSSYIAVTAFHFIEHLPLSAILLLIDEIKRVLIPGGKIILETPNPSNLIVGAHTFYMDPTHKNPLPPALMQFVIAQRGFDDVTVQGLQLPSESSVFKGFEGADVLNELLFGYQDYTVIGTKR